MSSIEQLKKATSLKDLAVILGYRPQHLSYLLYISAAPKYTQFEIPKKNGGARVIDAPREQLKRAQRRLADLLSECSLEIDAQHKLAPISHGFRSGRSIVTNARPHTNRRYVLNVDIENFFPSINFGRVRGFFIKNADFKLHKNVATVIAQIACHDSLPQGSPCSPIISDLITHILDVRLVRLAKEHRCTYSRYADDLTFSTNLKNFPVAIASFSKPDSTWALGEPLTTRIKNAGFSVNVAKTRMQCRISRQMVTGLVVNRKVNIRNEYFRAARQMCHSLFNTGIYHHPETRQRLTTVQQIEGMLNHVDFVKSGADRRDTDINTPKSLASERLYRRLVFFKYFAAPDRPLILCEGPSDSIYLKTAIHQLSENYPELIETVGEVPKLKLRFFAYRKRSSELLKLTGGTAPMRTFMEKYEETIDSFGFKQLRHPVIVLVDNDSGAKKIFGYINGKYKLNASLKSDGQFYFVCRNMYVIKTGEIGDSGVSKIEDSFEAALLQTPYQGKMFNAEDDKLSSTEFGKMALAGIVRSNADKINFAGFAELLNRIVAVLKHYQLVIDGDSNAHD